jgi:hypothetical protein
VVALRNAFVVMMQMVTAAVCATVGWTFLNGSAIAVVTALMAGEPVNWNRVAAGPSVPEDDTVSPYAHYTDAGEPILFSSCTRTFVAINPVNMPSGGRAVVRRAVNDFSDLSGVNFQLGPDTTEPTVLERRAYQPNVYGDRFAPVLISFEQDAALAGYATGHRVETAGQEVLVSGVMRLGAQDPNVANPDKLYAMVLRGLAIAAGLQATGDQLLAPVPLESALTFSVSEEQLVRSVGEGPCVKLPIKSAKGNAPNLLSDLKKFLSRENESRYLEA